MLDTKEIAKATAAVVKAHVAALVDPLRAAVAALEKRIDELPTPQNGKDADEEVIVARVRDEVSAELKDLRSAIEAIQPAPELPDIPGMVEQAVSDARGQDVTQIQSWMDGVDEKLAALPAPRDGKDADPIDMDAVRSMISESVTAAVAAIPAPQDGKSVTIDDVRPVIDDAVTRAVAALPKAKDGEPGKDGVGVAGAVIDRDGSLVVTLSNGDTKQLGLVVGKDGEPGKQGRDGFSLKDFDTEMLPDGQTILLKFGSGDILEIHELFFPVVVDRGVWREGEAYTRGSGVTWGGSFWIAQRDNPGKPDTADGGWRLAVKKGQPGKDAKNG
ncbi:MAG: hypothetical protein WBA48_03440 [Xanthobacteraceae bacterium]